MSTKTLFSILSLLCVVLAVSLGLDTVADWETAWARQDHQAIAGLAISFAAAFFFGLLALCAYLIYEHRSDETEGGLSNECSASLAMLVSAFCSGYLYGVAGAPLLTVSGWPHGYLTILLVGLLPVLMHFNQLLQRWRAAHEQPWLQAHENRNVYPLRPRT